MGGMRVKKVRSARAIRRVRVRLLAEHAGLRRPVEWRGLYRRDGLVACLDRLSETPNCRLHRYNPDYALGKSGRLRKQAGEDFSVDPAKPIIMENVFEHSADNMTALFTRGILLLYEWLRARGGIR